MKTVALLVEKLVAGIPGEGQPHQRGRCGLQLRAHGTHKRGARHVVIQPEPAGDVKWVKATWESVRGSVQVDWRKEGAVFVLNVGIPPGMTADVRIPGAAARVIGSGRHEFTQRR